MGTALPDQTVVRAGSVPSLAITVLGLYLREVSGWISTPVLLRLLGDVGVSETAARTTFTRLKQRQLLLSVQRNGIPGFVGSDTLLALFARGDRRILTPHVMKSDDRWCVVSFTVPESARSVRTRLRARLINIGCGMISPGLWISPVEHEDDIRNTLADLQVPERGYPVVVLLRTDTPEVAGSLKDSVAAWWDLDAVRALHRTFLAATDALVDRNGALSDREMFSAFVTLHDRWRRIPYVDPGLPTELMPEGWPGDESRARYRLLVSQLGPASTRHVATVVASGA